MGIVLNDDTINYNHCSTFSPSGNLSISCSPVLFDSVISHLLTGLKGGVETKGSFSLTNARTYIQTVTAITRHSGPRLSKHLVVIVPIIMFYTKIEREDELRESCLQAFEALVSRCYKEITPYIPEVCVCVCVCVCACVCMRVCVCVLQKFEQVISSSSYFPHLRLSCM